MKKQYNETVEAVKEITQQESEIDEVIDAILLRKKIDNSARRERIYRLAAELFAKRITHFNGLAKNEVDRAINEAKVFVDAFDKRDDLDV